MILLVTLFFMAYGTVFGYGGHRLYTGFKEARVREATIQRAIRDEL